MQLSEKQFYNIMTEKNLILKFEPIRFKTKNSHYVPDFYCINNNIFYEVIKSKSTYYVKKNKMKELMEKVILKIVNPNGTDFMINKIPAHNLLNTRKKKDFKLPLWLKELPHSINEKTIRKFKAKLILDSKKISQFAEDNDFNPAVFSLALNGHTNMREEYQKAIEGYLK